MDENAVFCRKPGTMDSVSYQDRIGEIAPDIVVSKTVHSPTSADWTQDQLERGLTVLESYPHLSNRQMYRVHNQRVERYVDRKVQFVLIARDEESTLQRWLDKYRIELKGWVLLDPNWETARAFGIRIPQTVFIDSGGRVVGFSRFNDDTDRQIAHVVEGRAEVADLHAESDFDGILIPALPASDTVYITPAQRSSGTIEAVGSGHWVALGLTFKGLIANAWGTHESLMDVSPTLDTETRYDVRLVLPFEEGSEAIARRIQLALEQYFQIEVSYETRSVTVFVAAAQEVTTSTEPTAGYAGWSAREAVQSLESLLPAGRTQPDSPIPIRQFPVVGKGFAVPSSPVRFSLGWVVATYAGRAGYQGLDVTIFRGRNEDFRQALQDDLGSGLCVKTWRF